MKNFMRTCGIIALILFGLGMALTVAGCALGGADKVSSVVSDVTGGKFEVNLGGDGNYSLQLGDISTNEVKEALKGILDNKIYNMDDFGSLFDSNQETKQGTVEKYQVSSAGVEELKLDLGGCVFTMEESEDDDFWVEARNVDKLQAYVDGDTLHLVSTKNGSIKGSDIKKTEVILYVPADFVFDKAKLDLGAGVLKADTFAAEKIEFKLGAGEVEVNHLDCDALELKVGAGSVRIKDASIGKVKSEVGAGSIEINGSVNGDAEFSCSAGNIDIALSNDYNDFDYKVDCSAGNVQLGEKKYTGLNKSEKIDNDAKNDMEIKCMAGNVKVVFQ